MDKPIGFQLIAYSLLLAGLGGLTHHLAPPLARTALITALAGGALCLVWGGRAVVARRGKAPAIVTLLPVTFVMLAQTVTVWAGRAEVPGRHPAAITLTVMFLLSFAMLLRITYAGVVFEGETPRPRTHG
jgi:hypothetical protein